MSKPVKGRLKAAERKSEPANQTRLTIPDLVILSLLAERAMHGYEVNATLEDRKIRDWAPVSRPQIYYSLDKLTKLRLIRPTSEVSPSAGPERRVLEATRLAHARPSAALEPNSWTQTKVHQPSLSWAA